MFVAQLLQSADDVGRCVSEDLAEEVRDGAGDPRRGSLALTL